jgi:hypothetical protein
MSWARDQNNVLHMLALGVAERVFGDMIQEGIGTREEFADLYLMYTKTRPGVGMGDAADELKAQLRRWLKGRTFAQIRQDLSGVQIEELPEG